MPTTTVRCSLSECREPANYKIAAPWSDGSFSELKTYGFACSNHLGPVFRAAEERQEEYPPAPGETVEELVERVSGLPSPKFVGQGGAGKEPADLARRRADAGGFGLDPERPAQSRGDPFDQVADREVIAPADVDHAPQRRVAAGDRDE